MQSKVFVFCAVLGVAYAAVGLAKHEPKPDIYKDVPGCYIEAVDSVIPPDGSLPLSEPCMEYRCGPEWVQYVSCGAVGVLPSQELVRDSSKPYPGCCPTVRDRIEPTNCTEADNSV